jgi:hypothetical protein
MCEVYTLRGAQVKGWYSYFFQPILVIRISSERQYHRCSDHCKGLFVENIEDDTSFNSPVFAQSLRFDLISPTSFYTKLCHVLRDDPPGRALSSRLEFDCNNYWRKLENLSETNSTWRKRSCRPNSRGWSWVHTRNNVYCELTLFFKNHQQIRWLSGKL